MQGFPSNLMLSAPRGNDANVVRVGTSLEQVLDRIDLDGPSYLLVQHEDGSPAGVVSTEDLLMRVSAADSTERARWSKRPVESILSVVFGPVGMGRADHQVHGDESLACTTYMYDGHLHAVATDSDVLLSWKSLEPFLTRAARDSVTGLTTRNAFLRSFECEFARARRNRKPLALILIDVDHFKQINDETGHATGDAVLNLIATAICTSVRSYDIAARFAGDEFVALCCECGPGEVHIPVHRIQDAVAELPLPDRFPLPQLTVSIGVAAATSVDPSLTCEAMLEHADAGLYAAKRHGRNCAFAIDLCDATGAAEPKLIAARLPRPVPPAPAIRLAAHAMHRSIATPGR